MAYIRLPNFENIQKHFAFNKSLQKMQTTVKRRRIVLYLINDLIECLSASNRYVFAKLFKQNLLISVRSNKINVKRGLRTPTSKR